MSIPGLTLHNMVDKLIELFPELKDRCTKETEWLDKDNGHLLYNFVLYGYIEESFASDREDKILMQRIFDFIEALLDQPDMGIKNVVHDICESISSDEIVLQKAQKYMGPNTKTLCRQISSP